jgi:hypothetical protein
MLYDPRVFSSREMSCLFGKSSSKQWGRKLKERIRWQKSDTLTVLIIAIGALASTVGVSR